MIVKRMGPSMCFWMAQSGTKRMKTKETEGQRGCGAESVLGLSGLLGRTGPFETYSVFRVYVNRLEIRVHSSLTAPLLLSSSSLSLHRSQPWISDYSFNLPVARALPPPIFSPRRHWAVVRKVYFYLVRFLQLRFVILLNIYVFCNVWSLIFHAWGVGKENNTFGVLFLESGW